MVDVEWRNDDTIDRWAQAWKWNDDTVQEVKKMQLILLSDVVSLEWSDIVSSGAPLGVVSKLKPLWQHFNHQQRHVPDSQQTEPAWQNDECAVEE